LKVLKMPAILKHHVHFNLAKGDGTLLQPGEMLTSEAAALGDCSLQAVRQWIKKHRIGRWVPAVADVHCGSREACRAFGKATPAQKVRCLSKLFSRRRPLPLSTLTSRQPSRTPSRNDMLAQRERLAAEERKAAAHLDGSRSAG
jgi:hypothetical protein